jgi:N-acetyl-anhydromuramyl-L-alanine amidase AmpD
MSSSSKLTRRNAIRGAVVIGVGATGGAAVLSATSAEADVAAEAAPTIASCATWGARPDTGLTQLSNKPNKIVIHHTATGNSGGTTKSSSYELARTIQGWHMDDNGWADSGQHFTVSRGGFIMEGRHTSLKHLKDGKGFVQGAHAPGANTDGIGIENQGTYTSATPPKELWDSLVSLCAYACKQYGIKPSAIHGHRDFSATACPGDAFYAKLPQLRKDVGAKLKKMG